MKKLFFFILIFLGPLVLFSQETEENETAPEAETVETETTETTETEGGEAFVLSPEYVLNRDIATATLAELADWCRSLGLDAGGGREELAARLREFYKLEAPVLIPVEESEEEGRQLLITIVSAESTEYFTVASVHEDYVRLRGGVALTLQDGEILHRIEAAEILYNRTRKLMTASGRVIYVKEEGDTVETFRGDGITVNLDNWSTAFMRGVSDHEIAEGETRYRFAGEVISRSGENSTVLRRAKITNADEEESYWSINASKLWLLPGSDWAVLNAVIKVGEIPVLYLPALYYPANEIIFHPVLGYRVREGTYVQTTTYLLGRPKAVTSTEESSITTIMGSGEGMEKVREGVFLRSTGRKVQDENETRLSLLGDAYVNLGYYLGSELSIPAQGYFGDLMFSAGVGFSRNIALDNGNFTPFFPDYDGTSEWHSSRFFDAELPFRYRFVSTGSVSGSGTVVSDSTLSWSLPFYSDPYVDNDFMRRSEDSSLFTLIKQATRPDMIVSDTSIDSYTWQLNGDLAFNTSGLSPYINELNINSAAMAVTFDTKLTRPYPDSRLSYPPNLYFFYPDKFTLFSVAASIGGTPISLGETNTKTGTEMQDLDGLGRPIPPWETVEENPDDGDPLALHPPELTRTIQAPFLGGNRFTLDYRLSPAASSEIQFNTGAWQSQEDIDWGDTAYQFYSVRADGTVGLTLSEKRDIYTNSLRFYGTASWQDYTYMNEDTYTPAEQEAAYRQVHNMTYFSTSAEYMFILRPFYQSDIWKTSDFRYSVKGLLARSEYDPVSDSWDVVRGKWNRDDIEFHRVQANINADVMDHMQNLSITADIPPEESILAGDATARIWISETNARTRVREPFEEPVYEPIYFTETFRFTDRTSLRHYMVYDPELSDFTILTTSLIWRGLSASFTATRSIAYELEEDPSNSLGRPVGWYLKDEEEKLNPQELSLAYQGIQSFNDGRRVTFETNLNTGLGFDLQRYTYSKFFFSMGLTTKINRFIDITLSTYSENVQIFRYFQGMPYFDDVNLELPGEKNVLKDLINSFRFDDVEKRRASGFKLKSFNLDVVHHLGDWDATLGIQLAPELDTRRWEYRFNTQISFVVQWKPIREFKTEMTYKTDEGFSYE
jgi:hypothetical protein